ncbi:hypothetical protein C0J52_03827 [Blattella germanica]|nr:hypothetical protein C0J52_03827 [Blattella germanica]
MHPWDKTAGDDNRTVSMFIIIPIVVSLALVWGARRWWSNTLPLHSHAVSRRRKLNPAAGRRPPALPLIKGPIIRSEDSTVMPSGRRNISRTGSNRPPPPPPPNLILNDDTHKTKSFGQATDNASSRVISPKHIPVPSIPQDGNFVFEVIMFVFTGMTSFLQFLHLYRTVWWLPQSYTRYTMNFYLIDPYLVGFIATILGRRLVYCALSRVLMSWSPATLWPILQQLLRLILLGLVLASLVWCAYHIMQSHPIVNIFYLCYPISVYFILFGLSISPFFDVTSLPPLTKEECKGRTVTIKPLHNCSMSPHAIREEVEILKTDFNNRMKQILFSSVLNAYYAGFVPCCFAQHLAFVWIGCFTMYIVHCYPVKYCDVLHRAALHLGRWARIEGRTSHIPTHMWAESTLWHQGALVKHCKELYKAEGISNAAEPGNQTHARFYAVFNNPSVLLFSLLVLQLSLVIVQIVILIRSSEWYRVISLTLLLFANYYTLFKLSRDYMCVGNFKLLSKFMDKIIGFTSKGNFKNGTLIVHAVFNNPSVLLCSLLGLQLSLVIMQIVILVRSSEWYHVVSLALLLFANYYTLFKLSRDYLVCWKVYKAEQMIQDKIGG